MSSDVPIRRLGVTDLPALVALAARVGWMAEDGRYSLLMGISEIYGIDSPAGAGLLGTVTLTRFAPSFATIGMMLVDPTHSGRGHGRRLMHHALGVAGDDTVALFATSAGRPLYEKLGFETLGSNQSHRGRYGGEPSGMTEVATDDDLPAIFELDRAVTRCDRGAFLKTFAGFADELRVKRDDGVITGYAGRWRLGELHVIGPVIAEATDAAIALAADLAAGANGEVRIEVADGHDELAAWANATGLERATTTSIMTLGGRPLPGDRDRWFMPVTLAIG